MKNRFFMATMLGLLALLLCGTALACPNPKPCPGNTYYIEYAKEAYHLLVCTECGYKTAYSHSGGQATCTKRAICDGCGHEYGDPPSGEHLWGEYSSDGNATCTADGTKTAKCSRCPETDTVADEGSALGHSFTNYTSNGDAQCTADGTKTAYCDNGCGLTDTLADTGSALGHSFTDYTSNGDATCTADGTKTAYCDRNCGATDTISDEGSALGHNYKAVVTEPTCVKSGYTTYTCTRCNNSYTDNKTAALQHWYGPWSFSGDMTHSATCRRDGCGYVRTRDCTTYTMTVGDNLVSICPVCNNMNGIKMSTLKATVTSVDNDVNSIPKRGELSVCGLEKPFDGVLYALTIAHEYAGKLDEFTGMVHIEMSLVLTDELPEFRLVRVDVTEAGEDTERTEVWTEIEYNYEDGVLSFDTDAAGMFLLLPVE